MSVLIHPHSDIQLLITNICEIPNYTVGRMATRIETDSFGPIEVPSDMLYGGNTARSIQNFKIGDQRDRMPVSTDSVV